jgi:hypothetical protein
VRELEDALSSFAGDNHRLLRDELRKLKEPFLTEQPVTSALALHQHIPSPPSSTSSRSGSLHPSDEVSGSGTATVDATGALTVAGDGAIEYIGHEAKLWVSVPSKTNILLSRTDFA